MSWMDESFKKDKRYLDLQLKRGHIKSKDIDSILSDLPDVSSKAMVIESSEQSSGEPISKNPPDPDKKA